MQVRDFKEQEMNIMSLPFIERYIQMNFPDIQIQTVTPYSFTIGSNNAGEGIDNKIYFPNSLFFGMLQVCINPNNSILSEEKIEIKYRSYLNEKPFYKRITRLIELENYINEASVSNELFDDLTITQASVKYDFYLTFVGFKIDYK